MLLKFIQTLFVILYWGKKQKKHLKKNNLINDPVIYAHNMIHDK